MSHTRPDLLDEAWRAGDPHGSENLLNDLKTALEWLREAEESRDKMRKLILAMDDECRKFGSFTTLDAFKEEIMEALGA